MNEKNIISKMNSIQSSYFNYTKYNKRTRNLRFLNNIKTTNDKTIQDSSNEKLSYQQHMIRNMFMKTSKQILAPLNLSSKSDRMSKEKDTNDS